MSARVVIKPFTPTSKTFATHEEAKAWADEVEAELRSMRDVHGVRDGAVGSELVGQPRTMAQIMRLPRLLPNQSMSGIYFLFKDGECIYIGQSRQVYVRVREHRTTKGPTRAFDSYSWVRCDIENLDRIEQWYIEKFSPIYNTTWNEAGRRRRRRAA